MVFSLTSKKANVNIQNLLLFILSSHFYKLLKRNTEVKIWQQKTEEFSHLNPIRCLHNLVKMKLGGRMCISEGPRVALGPQVWQPWFWLHFQMETDVFQALNGTHVQRKPSKIKNSVMRPRKENTIGTRGRTEYSDSSSSSLTNCSVLDQRPLFTCSCSPLKRDNKARPQKGGTFLRPACLFIYLFLLLRPNCTVKLEPWPTFQTI